MSIRIFRQFGWTDEQGDAGESGRDKVYRRDDGQAGLLLVIAVFEVGARQLPVTWWYRVKGFEVSHELNVNLANS
jgi:hypothetical protein